MLDATRQRPGDPWLAVWTAEILRGLGGLTNVLQGGRLTEPVVHKSRRELKRLRSLLRLAPASIVDLADDTREVTGELRRRFGHSRDATVMLKTLQSFAGELGDTASRINPVLSAHHRQASAMLDRRSRRWDRDRMARFGELWRASPIRGNASHLCKGAVKTYRRARRQALALAKGKDAALHPLRKACVDHQNHLAFFTLGTKGKIAARHGKLRRLRDQLGLCHDLEVLRDFVRTRSDVSASDLIHLEEVLMRRHGELVQKAIKSSAVLFAGKPRQFEKWFARELGKVSISGAAEASSRLEASAAPMELQKGIG
ncbi:MAG: CHAD domain-containing protein [Hyphomicrobiales bacterium]|nr:CHAD domain-containing protein [Hyphomicrobiales bacterium]